MNHLPQRKINGGNDEYFTKPSVAEKCVNSLFAKLDPALESIFIEPSAGNGVFSKIIMGHDKKIISYDIEPQHKSIIKKDFLNINFNKNNIKDAIFIGNPPFGTCSNLAIKFFNKSSEAASHIGFILPKTFRKHSIQMKINHYFHLIHDEDLPKNSFLVNGVEHDVPTVFQIWEKQKNKREPLRIPNDYITWTKKSDADFAIRRVGGNAGTIYTDNFLNFSDSSNYFCVEKCGGVIEKLKQADFRSIVNNTAGVRSLSKLEILNFLHSQC
ncbi:MAG: hypothetical protein HAW61_00340 [Candidatus Portiera sp.]|nr:hypothetical protein [Portiera sp.]